MSEDERDQFVAAEIKAGRCPFGMLGEGKKGVLFCCELGLPGCACADEMELNPHLKAEWDEIVDKAFEAMSKIPPTADEDAVF